MATFQELHAAVLRAPDDDAPRLALAEYYRVADPELGRFVELQVQLGAARRAGRPGADAAEHETAKLLKKHGARWSQTLGKYTKRQLFDRGLIGQVSIDPYLFLEYGEWLFVNAPIRSVFFTRAQDGDAFPLAELLASPLIARLDAIALVDLGLTDADVEVVAASPTLADLLVLSLGENPLTLRAFEAIAASPHLRKLLEVSRSPGRSAHTYTPAAIYAETDRDDRDGRPLWAYRALPPDGVALEARHGYLPWLHPQDNACSVFDARYLVERGKLPVKMRGTPVR